MNSMKDCYELANGVKIPCMGYGTYKAAEGNNESIIKTAIEAGYRYFDTASFYDTEEALGRAIHESGIPREEFFLTSKAWKTEMGYEEVKKAFAQTLEKLGTDYLDMYLIHWPLPNPKYKDWKELDVETWRGLEELYKAGKVKAIGVSNFLLHHLENLIQNCEIMPMADQIEFHPGFTQEATVRYCQEKGIYVQAWSPLGRKRVLEHPLLVGLAEKYNKSAAQICLRYEIQRRVIPLPKASTKERMVQNYQVFDFEIEKEDMYRIDSMQPAGWSGEHPDFPRVK